MSLTLIALTRFLSYLIRALESSGAVMGHGENSEDIWPNSHEGQSFEVRFKG